MCFLINKFVLTNIQKHALFKFIQKKSLLNLFEMLIERVNSFKFYENKK